MTKRNSFIESTKETDERLEALKQLYPEIFSDGKINLDAFKDVTGTSDLPEGQDRTPGYYGLYWPGKRAAKQLARKEAEGTLEPVPSDGVNEDTTHNIYIEGDNLEVLHILKQSYKGRVKMIYIDPPYNTGEDFIYPDNYKMPVEEYLKISGQTDESGKKLVTNAKSNGAFHTNWLNMIYPRLQLARELLSDDGVIFISINDNEQANLKLICDDVFGEENFMADFPRVTKKGGKSSDVIALNHDYCLMYTKSSNGKFYPIEHTDDGFSNSDEFVNERGMYKLNQTLDYDTLGYINSLDYPIKIDNETFYPGNVTKAEFEKRKKENPKDGYRWRWSKDLFDFGFANGFVVVKKGKNGSRIYTKTYQNAKIEKDGNSYYVCIEERTKSLSTLETTDNKYSNDNAKKGIDTILGKGIFDYTKPVSLIDLFSKLTTKNNDIIMDFFSGSATTAQAVLESNFDDKEHRKFIMVQLPFACDEKSEAYKSGYKNICEIGKERIRRAGAKILEESKSNKDMFSEDYQLDIGFKVYRLQNSNFVKYTPVEGQDEDSQNKLFEEFEKNQIPLVNGWKAENVLTEIILKQGFALDCTKEKVDSFKKNTIWKITDSADAVSKKIKLYVCLDNSIEEETIKNLTLNDDEKFICLDAAIDDSAYARLADKGRIETI